jgi:hypothetical protein
MPQGLDLIVRQLGALAAAFELAKGCFQVGQLLGNYAVAVKATARAISNFPVQSQATANTRLTPAT